MSQLFRTTGPSPNPLPSESGRSRGSLTFMPHERTSPVTLFYPSSIWTPSPRNTWIADCIRKLVLNYDIQFADLTSSSIQESLKRISRLEFLTISHHNGCQRLDWSNYPVRLALLHLLHLPTLTHFEMSRIGSYSLRQPQVLRYRLLYDCGSWKSFPCNFAWAFNPTERIRSRVQNLCRHHDHWFWISV